MSPKRKPGLHAGLSEIIERQTAPASEKSEESKRLIARFSEPAVPSHGIPPESIPALSIPPAPPKVAALVNPDRGYYPTFNDVSDGLIPEMKLDAYEQAVLWRLYRLSRGWWRDTCTVGHTRLANATNLSRSTVQKTVAKLIERGVIEFVGERGNDGTEYRVLPGVAVPQRGIPRDDIPPEFKERGPRGTRRPDGIPPSGHIKNKEDLKNRNKASVCDLCQESPGFIYPSGIVGQGPVKTCPHREGK